MKSLLEPTHGLGLLLFSRLLTICILHHSGYSETETKQEEPQCDESLATTSNLEGDREVKNRNTGEIESTRQRDKGGCFCILSLSPQDWFVPWVKTLWEFGIFYLDSYACKLYFRLIVRKLLCAWNPPIKTVIVTPTRIVNAQLQSSRFALNSQMWDKVLLHVE